MASQSTYRYLDIDSTYRNRKQYPNPTDFVMPVNTTGNFTPAMQSTDPIALSYPIVNSTTQAGSTVNDIVLNASSSSIDNYYTDLYVEIGGEYRIITSYAAGTQTAIVDRPFSVAPGAGTPYNIQGQTPILSLDTLAAGSSQIVINLGVAASNINGAYNGQFIYFISGPNQGVAMQISNYIGSTKQALLIKSLPNIPGLDTYNILGYTRDNSFPLIYPGTLGFNQPVCYSIELLYITIPNVPLSSGYGGTFKNYPYIYLQLFNEGNIHSSQTLYSNNPNAKMALFKVPIGLNLSSESFFTLKDARMIQTVKIKFDQPLHFRLLFPDGEPIILNQTDNMSPQAPDPMLQFSASFAFRRIDQQFEK